MSRLKPWTEDCAPDAILHLILAARGEKPSSDALAQTLAALGAGVATASATAATAAPLGSAGVSGVVTTKTAVLGVGVSALKWMLLGVGLGAAGVATIEHGRVPERAVPALAPRPSTAPLHGVRSRTELPRVVNHPVASEISDSAAQPPTKSVVAAPTRAKDEPSAAVTELRAAPPANIDSERLAEEVRAIDDASVALRSGRMAQTLALLDDYDRRYPEHRFAPEALYLRLEALVQSGRTAEAREVAERLVSAYPKSPQSARARLLLKQTIP